MWNGAIDSSGVLLPYPLMPLASYMTYILISTLNIPIHTYTLIGVTPALREFSQSKNDRIAQQSSKALRNITSTAEDKRRAQKKAASKEESKRLRLESEEKEIKERATTGAGGENKENK